MQEMPAKKETWVGSLGGEDLLEKEMATHSSFLAQEIPWTEELGGYNPRGQKRVGHASETKQQAWIVDLFFLQICNCIKIFIL